MYVRIEDKSDGGDYVKIGSEWWDPREVTFAFLRGATVNVSIVFMPWGSFSSKEV